MEFRHYELGRELASHGPHGRHHLGVLLASLHVASRRRPGRIRMDDVGGLTYCWVKVPILPTGDQHPTRPQHAGLHVAPVPTAGPSAARALM